MQHKHSELRYVKLMCVSVFLSRVCKIAMLEYLSIGETYEKNNMEAIFY